VKAGPAAPNLRVVKDDDRVYGRRFGRGRLFWGGLLVGFGTLSLLEKFSYLGGYSLGQLWPLMIVWAGIVGLLAPGGDRWGGLFGVALGAAGLAVTTGSFPLRWDVIWPVLIIFFGLRVLLRRGHRHRHGPMREDCLAGTTQGPVLGVDLFMSGARDVFDQQVFEGGVVRCRASGYELDLRGAILESESATIDVDIVMGGMEIRIPRDWRVEVQVHPVAGAVEDHSRLGAVAQSKRLVIRGRVALGGIEIKN
jgi:hypothetical protein